MGSGKRQWVAAGYVGLDLFAEDDGSFVDSSVSFETVNKTAETSLIFPNACGKNKPIKELHAATTTGSRFKDSPPKSAKPSKTKAIDKNEAHGGEANGSHTYFPSSAVSPRWRALRIPLVMRVNEPNPPNAAPNKSSEPVSPQKQ